MWTVCGFPRWATLFHTFACWGSEVKVVDTNNLNKLIRKAGPALRQEPFYQQYGREEDAVQTSVSYGECRSPASQRCGWTEGQIQSVTQGTYIISSIFVYLFIFLMQYFCTHSHIDHLFITIAICYSIIMYQNLFVGKHCLTESKALVWTGFVDLCLYARRPVQALK